MRGNFGGLHTADAGLPADRAVLHTQLHQQSILAMQLHVRQWYSYECCELPVILPELCGRRSHAAAAAAQQR